MRHIKRMAYRLLPSSLIGLGNAVVARTKKSFAGFGEDIVLERLLLELLGRRPGTYVDVGAFHPVYFSNTKLLYDSGWRGVNIEADPHKLSAFRLFRPRDVNVCAVVDTVEREAEFFFHAGAKYGSMAGLDKGNVEHTANAMGRSVASRVVRTRTLASILIEAGVESVDFLNIDVEGSEASVLRSLDLDRYRIPLIACEVHAKDIAHILESDAVRYLSGYGYVLSAWTPPTIFMQRRDAVPMRYGDEQNDADRLW
jgi:FkbM family methyltransferase